MLRCLNRTIDFTATRALVGNGARRRRGRERARDVYALGARSGWWRRCRWGCRSRSTTTWPSPRAPRARREHQLDALVERCLRQAALWDEVKDRLASLGTALSGGQQQRLTIARALSHQPEILCLDEFSIAIDPVTTMRIEDVLKELRREMTIVLVTNLTQQARRLADRTMFLLDGELVELDRTEVIFSAAARSQRTRDYVAGCSDERPETSAPETNAIETRRLSLWYGSFQALKEVTISLRQGIITSLIGPSGCGKTRCCAASTASTSATATCAPPARSGSGREHLRAGVSLVELRKGVGMVFQRPNPLPSRSTRTSCSAARPHAARESEGASSDEAVEKRYARSGLCTTSRTA
jgi:phosphate transport system ATP-binding protein